MNMQTNVSDRVYAILIIVICLCSLSLNAYASTKTLFLTGGQSNTDGRLYSRTLPSYLVKEANNNSSYCKYTTGSGKFYGFYPTSEKEGSPARWAYDAVTYYYIGQALKEEFYVAKTSYGGTSIDPSVSNSPSSHSNSWLSEYGGGYHWSANESFLSATTATGTTFQKDGVTYDGQSLLKTWINNIDAAIDALKSDGSEVDIKCIIWHQGESDRNVSSAYYDNLKEMLTYVRNHIAEKTGESKYVNLPFFCGNIPDKSSQGSGGVNNAFKRLDAEDENFHLVDIYDITMGSDNIHFSAEGAELFGKRLYNSLVDNNIISGNRLDDVQYAVKDYSDFGSDEFVAATTTWDFDSQSGSFYSGSKIIEAMYFHGGGSTQRRFEFYTGQTAQKLTYPDGFVQNATSYVRSNLGTNCNVTDISDTWTASKSVGNGVGLNTKFSGTFTIFVLPEEGKTVRLYFNGMEVASTSSSDQITALTYKATAAGTYYIYCNGAYKMWGARYVSDTDISALRTIITDDNGYALFGNISGLNLGLPDGVKAWGISPSNESSSEVIPNRMKSINSGSAALIQGEPNTEYVLPFAWTTAVYDFDNCLVAQSATGIVETVSGDDFVNYLYANKSFVKADGTQTLEAGKAYLSISVGSEHASQNILTIVVQQGEDYSDYDFTEVTFGSDATVSEAMTWTFDDKEEETYEISGKDCTFLFYGTEEYNKLYVHGYRSNNRGYHVGTASNMSLTFSDDTKVSINKFPYCTNDGNGGNKNIMATSTASTSATNSIALNVSGPGKLYVFASANGSNTATFTVYFNGEVVGTYTNNDSSIPTEIIYTAKKGGTIYVYGANAHRFYAVRFVPTEKPEETSVKDVREKIYKGNDIVYNLQGLPVSENYSGVVIKNRKKYIR